MELCWKFRMSPRRTNAAETRDSPISPTPAARACQVDGTARATRRGSRLGGRTTSRPARGDLLLRAVRWVLRKLLHAAVDCVSVLDILSAKFTEFE